MNINIKKQIYQFGEYWFCFLEADDGKIEIEHELSVAEKWNRPQPDITICVTPDFSKPVYELERMNWKSIDKDKDTTSLLLVKFLGFQRKLYIPSEINGYKVTEIEQGFIRDYDFQNNKWQVAKPIQEIIIPDSVRKIRPYAFIDSFLLRSIEIPKSVETIGSDAFANCTNLNYIKIPVQFINNLPNIFSGILPNKLFAIVKYY